MNLFEDRLREEYVKIGSHPSGEYLLTEGVVSSILNKIQSLRPKILLYSDGKDGLISIAKNGRTNASLFHSKRGKTVREEESIDVDDAIDYAKENGYRRLLNWKSILKVASVFASGALLAVGAGTIAVVATRLIITLAASHVSAGAAEVSNEAIEASLALQRNVEDVVEVKSGGEVSLDIPAMSNDITSYVSDIGDAALDNSSIIGSTLWDFLGNTAWWYVSSISTFLASTVWNTITGIATAIYSNPVGASLTAGTAYLLGRNRTNESI